MSNWGSASPQHKLTQELSLDRKSPFQKQGLPLFWEGEELAAFADSHPALEQEALSDLLWGSSGPGREKRGLGLVSTALYLKCPGILQISA